MKSKKVKFICAVSATLFSLLTCFTGVFAWFAAQGNSKNQNHPFVEEYDPNLLNFAIDLYRYNRDTKKGYATHETAEGFSFDLTQYDKFVPERNEYNNNIIRIQINFLNQITTPNRKLNFDIKCEPTTKGATFDNGLKDGKKRVFADDKGYKYTCESVDYVCNKISDVIYFKFLPYTYTVGTTTYKFNTSINIDETNESNTYFNATDVFKTINEKHFVDNKAKNTTLNYSLSTINSQTKSMILYVEYCYNTSLVDDFLYPNEFVVSPESSEIFIGGVAISFFKDVLGMYITTEGVS